MMQFHGKPVQYGHFTFVSGDGTETFVHRWLPVRDGRIRGAVQIAHGMAEHAGRYAQCAGALADAGYAVYANDHRGHGRTAGAAENLGHFADRNGWEMVVEDMRRLGCTIAAEHPGLPVFLFGHSMGSFLARSYIVRHGKGVRGVILSGTGGDPGLPGRLGIMLARWEIRIRGVRAKSPLLTKLTFGRFNAPFRPNRTPYDWLSGDEAAVDRYLADPLCGSICSATFFRDLLGGIRALSKAEATRTVPADLPVLLFSGERDPVGKGGRGVGKVYRTYRNAGVRDVTLKVYQGGRHEMLNEINREEVYRDLIGWLHLHC